MHKPAKMLCGEGSVELPNMLSCCRKDFLYMPEKRLGEEMDQFDVLNRPAK